MSGVFGRLHGTDYPDKFIIQWLYLCLVLNILSFLYPIPDSIYESFVFHLASTAGREPTDGDDPHDPVEGEGAAPPVVPAVPEVCAASALALSGSAVTPSVCTLAG